jgi:hypothetical protein
LDNATRAQAPHRGGGASVSAIRWGGLVGQQEQEQEEEEEEEGMTT